MIQFDIYGNPLLVHYGAVSFDKKKFKKIANSNWVKPTGGLWTSPVDSEYGWGTWCNNENFRACEDDNKFILQLNRDAKIYKIDSLADLEKLPHIGMPHVPISMMCFPDFEQIAKSYDAIWLTVEGQWATRMSHPKNLYGWDCESVLLLNSKCFTQK